MDAIRQNLIELFDRANLKLSLAAEPLARTTSSAIVQLDIRRGKTKADEHFRLWPGAASNHIAVQGVDRSLEQLVLLVHEPRRSFQFEMNRKLAERTPGLKIVRKTERQAWVERVTDASKRHFLVGMDEQHCFIAQLPHGASTVQAAHALLRPPELDARAAGKAVRQGEFFFVEPTADQLKRYLQLGRGIGWRTNVGIAAAAKWVRAGRQHVAEAVWALADGIVLVKGNVRHPDHKTLYFSDWRRVFQNREAYEAPPPGVLWVD
ncbi:MAG: hypothetical protein JNK82_21840 [Myxococcaceae bacterium]|nr:hypothetical protein [Myxococcaceae bacterium]